MLQYNNESRNFIIAFLGAPTQINFYPKFFLVFLFIYHLEKFI